MAAKRSPLEGPRSTALLCARYVAQFIPDELTWEKARDTVAHEVRKNYPNIKPRTLKVIANAATRAACAE